MTDRPRYLDRVPPPRPRQIARADEYRPMLDTQEVAGALRNAIDRLRDERTTNDERAARAGRRGDEIDASYWRSRADGLSAGLAAMRDTLYGLTGEEY